MDIKMSFTKVGSEAMFSMMTVAFLSFVVPLVLAIVWKVKKKEKFTSTLVGAGVFILFALILEKSIQNVLVFPTLLGMPSNGIDTFLNAHPLLLGVVVAMFPGVFEETGRLIAFKTLLKNRKNRETSISYGIGHAGIEVTLLVGLTYVSYLMYAAIINSGSYGSIVEQTRAIAPDQVDVLLLLPEQLAAVTFLDCGLVLLERVFAVLFHIGASILVFYACKDKGKFWLYPLAILLHAVMDFPAGLVSLGIVNIPIAAVEIVFAICSTGVFLFAYKCFYKKDVVKKEEAVEEVVSEEVVSEEVASEEVASEEVEVEEVTVEK